MNDGLPATLREIAMAIEKQQPKEPDIYGEAYDNGVPVRGSWKCPRCGFSYRITQKIQRYCPNCGQRIKWEWEE